ncbi:MAG: PorV/PorQ family protein [Elusimicrobia bacterium]|nr:PorV/PorQ family protein [Elusimicrobiota bacterium]
MKNRTFLKLIAAACCAPALFPAASYAGAGRSGGEFLRIVQSPRAVGMGESGAGAHGDLLGALALNPAALARSGYKETAFTYNSWLEGITSQQAAYAHPLAGGKGVLAASLNILSVPSIDGYNNAGAPAGGVDAGDLAFGVSYARRLAGPWEDLRSGLFAGGSVKYARETLGPVKAGAALFDAGALWLKRLGSSMLGLGLSAQSLGGGFKFDSVAEKAPAVYRAGASYIMVVSGDPITLSLDWKKPWDSGAAVCAGAEYQAWRVLSLRAGYISGEDLGGGLRLGGGVAIKLLQFDYSLSSYGKFGPAHRFGLSYKFDKPVEVTRYLTWDQEQARQKTERARLMIRESRYYDAVLELNGALILDPGNKEALELMRKARGLVEVSK